MMANLSVLSRDVKVPKAVLPEDVIPQAYRDWYRAVLADGKRVPPPIDLQSVIIVQPRIHAITGDGNIIVTEIKFRATEDIRKVFYSHGSTVVTTDNEVHINNHPSALSHDHYIAFTPKTNEAIVAYQDGVKLKLRNMVRRYDIPIDLDVDTIAPYDGRLLVKSNSSIFEINLTETGSKTIATASVVGNVLPHATRLYSGVAIQNLLGSAFVSLFPERNACYQVKTPELDKYRIIEAKFDSGVLMVIGVKNNKYDRLVFKFNKTYSKYELRIVKDITNTGLNFVTLDSGICVCLNEDENIEAFSSKIGSRTIKIVEDSALSGDMTLFKMGAKVGFFRGTKLYNMVMS